MIQTTRKPQKGVRTEIPVCLDIKGLGRQLINICFICMRPLKLIKTLSFSFERVKSGHILDGQKNPSTGLNPKLKSDP